MPDDRPMTHRQADAIAETHFRGYTEGWFEGFNAGFLSHKRGDSEDPVVPGPPRSKEQIQRCTARTASGDCELITGHSGMHSTWGGAITWIAGRCDERDPDYDYQCELWEQHGGSHSVLKGQRTWAHPCLAPHPSGARCQLAHGHPRRHESVDQSWLDPSMCGDKGGILGGPIYECEKPAGHPGGHEGMGLSWERSSR